ncbi:MAG: hypothetical protein E6Q97_30635 [Desulfurellales bacterium]|nr:MAG: hypothetical protein E6Q97_30635 [Desulfurellales bacterium]
MKAPSPIAVIRSILGPEQADALLRGGIAPSALARTVLEATAPADLAATLAAAGLEKAEPLSARTVLSVQNLVRLNQLRADRAVREAALGKAEKLEKRSKNVREKTTNITPEQAEGRRVRYAQSLGLEPTKTQGEGMPKPSRNKLPYGGNFPVEHEVAHAMMTPGGKTIRQYTDSLSSRARAGKKALSDERDAAGYEILHNFNDLYHDYHDAEQEENTARMLEHHIDRRSGVNPSRPELQASAQIAAGAPMHSFRRIDVPEEHPFNNYWDYSNDELEDEPSRGRLFKPKDKKQLEQEARSGARREIQRWDAGSKFKSGKVVPPSGLDARINARAGGGGFRKAEHAPKTPPDQKGVGPKHDPEEPAAPTKQLEPQVHANRGAKRAPAALEKRSKNVREQTRNITNQQAQGRRQQYARLLGLKPQNVGRMAELRDLKGANNDLKYGGRFDLPHELGHAMRTRPGRKLSEHMAGITPDDQFDDDVINSALEHRIDRRAGVDPHKFAGEFRGTIGDPEYSPPYDDYDDLGDESDDENREAEGAPPIEWNADLVGPRGRRNRGSMTEELAQQQDRADSANQAVSRFDLGHRFDASGKLQAPKGIDAKINRRAGILKSDAAEWRSRPILRPEDARDLDHAAAARSLSSGSTQEGERMAYEEYSRNQRLDAMAHHFRQAGEAQQRGDRPTSDRHMLAYAAHARAIGADPVGTPPPEVGERIRQLAGKRASFRSHPADRLA